jgi:hypothetical protein
MYVHVCAFACAFACICSCVSQASDFGDLQLGTRKIQIVTTEKFEISIRRGI